MFCLPRLLGAPLVPCWCHACAMLVLCCPPPGKVLLHCTATGRRPLANGVQQRCILQQSGVGACVCHASPREIYSVCPHQSTGEGIPSEHSGIRSVRYPLFLCVLPCTCRVEVVFMQPASAVMVYTPWLTLCSVALLSHSLHSPSFPFLPLLFSSPPLPRSSSPPKPKTKTKTPRPLTPPSQSQLER